MAEKPLKAPVPFGFRRLDAWRLARSLVFEVYRGTARFPDSEKYGMTSQLRRSAVSVAANLAEGSAKKGSREFRRYLDIALGSLAEIECLLILAFDLDFLAEPSYSELLTLRERTARVVFRLYEFHRKRAAK